MMPDQSCRSCGGELGTYSLCSECRKVTQKICKCCNALTRKQFHTKCVKSERILASKENQVFQLVQRAVSKSPTSGRSLIMICGVIGFFTLGFATAAYLGLFQNAISVPNTDGFQNQPYGAKEAQSPISVNNMGATSNQSYENCLAYGSGESLTVTCPTQDGYVYKAILEMPIDLANKFSDTVFSVRGISLAENLDGSVTMQYQNSNYKTNFFPS